MLVSVLDILKSPGLSSKFKYKGPFDIVEVDLAGDVEINVKLTNVGSRILVMGTISTVIIMECSRCTENFEQEVCISIEEEFLPQGSPELDAEILDWDNLSQFSYSGDVIDLHEIIRQSIIAYIPMMPLCREDCTGIKIFGLNSKLEEGLSEGSKKSIDPRLLPLLSIKKKAEDEKKKKSR